MARLSRENMAPLTHPWVVLRDGLDGDGGDIGDGDVSCPQCRCWCRWGCSGCRGGSDVEVDAHGDDGVGFEAADDVEECGDAEGVVAGLVEEVDGDRDALHGRVVLHWSLTSATAARAALSSTIAGSSQSRV